MKNLKNKILAGAFTLASLGIFGNENLKAQDNLNFYFETKENGVSAWLCECPKEEKKGITLFYYKDANNDKFYENVLIQKNNPPIKTRETFQYNMETMEVDYQLDFYDLSTDEYILGKEHKNISREEAKNLGEEFTQRINSFVKTQKEFSRFNSGQLKNLVREENNHKLKIINGKLIGNSKTPVEKILAEYEIEKVENYYSPAEETRRKEEKENIERGRIEEKEREQAILEKERMEREMKKLSKTEMAVKIGGGRIKSRTDQGRFLFEVTPQLNIHNLKGRGIAVGLDIWLSNLVFFYGDHYNSTSSEKLISWVGGVPEYQITNTQYLISSYDKNNPGAELNLKYVSPLLELSLGVGILNQKRLVSTTIKTETYIKKGGIIQNSTRKESEETEINIYKDIAFYESFGLEVFPFFKQKNPVKNLSFFIEGLITPISKTGFKTGIKYAFKKNK